MHLPYRLGHRPKSTYRYYIMTMISEDDDDARR